jgi:hypothetical protein
MNKKNIRFGIIALVLVGLFSCTEEEKFNVHINGNIEGLRKGKLYLQRLQDTLLVTLDSVSFENEEAFALKANVNEPELMLLQLQKHGSDDYMDYLTFFVEEGEYAIDAKMTNFQNANITTDSKNQQKWNEYTSMLRKFNNQQLDFLAEQIAADEEKRESLQKQLDMLVKRKYFYTINFALSNKELAVSPYAIISEAYDANIKYLDSVYNSYSEEMKNSLYGKQFNELLLERKIDETEEIL